MVGGGGGLGGGRRGVRASVAAPDLAPTPTIPSLGMVRPQEGGIVVAVGTTTAIGTGIVHEGIPAGFHRRPGLGVRGGLRMALLRMSLRGRPSPGTAAAAAPPSRAGERSPGPAPRAATLGIVCICIATTAVVIGIVAVTAASAPASAPTAAAGAGHALLHGGQKLRPAAAPRRPDVRGRGGTERIQLGLQRVRPGGVGVIVVAGIGGTGQRPWRLLLLISSAGSGAGAGRVHG